MSPSILKIRYLIYIVTSFLVTSCTVYKPVSSDTVTETVKDTIVIPPDTIAITKVEIIETIIDSTRVDLVYVRDKVKEDELKTRLDDALENLNKVQKDLSSLKAHLIRGSTFEVDKFNITTNTQIVKEENKINFDKIMIYLILLVFLVVVFKSLINK